MILDMTRIAALILMGVALAACGEQNAAEETQPRPIAWVEVTPVDTTTTRELAGVTQSAQRAPLSFEVPGTVESVAYETGETFQKGDVLAKLNTRNLQLALEQRQSELSEAKAQLKEASSDLKRQQELFNEGWVAAARLEDAQSARDTAKSRVSSAEARLRRAKEDLQDATLKAPYDGVIAERLIEPSQQVVAGQTVFRIQGREGGIEIEVSVPETIVNRLEIGSEHTVIPQIGDRPELTGVIVEVATEAAARNAFPVTLRLNDPPDELRSGTTAEVRLTLAKEGTPENTGGQRLSIPLTAYLPADGNGSVVFRFDAENGVVRRVPVMISDVGDDMAYVSEGLKAGDVIAAKGVAFLRDGQEVTLLDRGPRRFNP